jgi:hypothetical protein
MRAAEELTLDQSRRLVGIHRVFIRGKNDEPAHPGTVRLYIRDGYRPRGYRGEPVYLRAVLIGQSYCTLPEWVDEFELARARLGLSLRERARKAVPQAVNTRGLAGRLRRAEKELERLGV